MSETCAHCAAPTGGRFTRGSSILCADCFQTKTAAELSAPTCKCPPCPGRGNDGHGLSHCAECCFGTGVEVDLDCPTHGLREPA